MRSSAVVLALSFAANLALIAVLGVRFARRPDAPPAAKNSPPISPTLAPAAVDSALWSRLEHGEAAGFFGRLRAAGFPPALARAMIDAQVRQHFAARHQAIAEAEHARPYWRDDFFNPTSADPKLNAERRALARDAAALRAQLLGPEASQPSEETVARYRQRYGDLPREKLLQLQKIIDDYNELTAEARDTHQGILLPEDRARLALIQKEREADIARLLSPEEKIEYEFRHSTTANRLRQQLGSFEVTEEEYRSLFELYRAVDVAYGNPNTLSAEQRRARNNAQKQLTGKIEAALGPARFAEYRQGIDPTFQSLRQLGTRLELPAAATTQAFTAHTELNQRLAATRNDRSLTPEQRQAQLVALHREATTRLTATLGERGFQHYLETDGFWLRDLQRSSQPAVRSPQP